MPYYDNTIFNKLKAGILKRIFLIVCTVIFAFSADVMAQPISLSSSNITFTSVDLNWDASPCPGNVTLNYRVAGTAIWTFVSQANPQTLTGLDTLTTYEWKLKCAGGGNPWSEIQSFSTNGPGCTDSNAYNYNPAATVDDGSCTTIICDNTLSIVFSIVSTSLKTTVTTDIKGLFII